MGVRSDKAAAGAGKGKGERGRKRTKPGRRRSPARAVPPDGRKAASPAAAAELPPPDTSADPYAAVSMNPNFRILRRLVGPVVRSGRGRRVTQVWMEEEDDGEMATMAMNPETPLERGEADELHRLSDWRSWR